MSSDPAIGSPDDWLRRARSSLALARVAKPEDTLWEDLAFHAQQAAEKALKSVLVARAIPFRRVHDINELLVCLAGGGLVIPEPLKNAVDLSLYAVDARYPGSLEPMDKTEFIEAMQRAEAVVAWAERVLREKMDGS